MTKPSRERARASKATPAASARGVGATTTTTKAKAKAKRAADGGRGDGAARDDAKRGRDARASGEEGAKANDDDGFDVDALFGDAKKRAVKMNSGAREAAAAAEAPRVRVLLPGQKKPKQKRDKPEFTPVDKPRRSGELLGYKQSGVPTLRFANLNRDLVILENARNDADSLIEKNDAKINEHMKRWLRNFEEIVTV